MKTADNKHRESAIDTKELAELIFDGIKEETYYTKEIIVPKITAMIKAFRLRLSTVHYNSIEKPTDKDRLRRANEILNRKKNFWKIKVIQLIGEENMQSLYDEENKIG